MIAVAAGITLVALSFAAYAGLKTVVSPAAAAALTALIFAAVAGLIAVVAPKAIAGKPQGAATPLHVHALARTDPALLRTAGEVGVAILGVVADLALSHRIKRQQKRERPNTSAAEAQEIRTINENTIKGDVKTSVGKVEDAAGDVLDDRELQAKGGATQAEGRAQDAVGSAQQAMGQVADQASDAASRVADQAKDAYGRVSDQAQPVRDVVDPFVRRSPTPRSRSRRRAGSWSGSCLRSRGPKVVYVKPRG